jgi:hypothetical protein
MPASVPEQGTGIACGKLPDRRAADGQQQRQHIRQQRSPPHRAVRHGQLHLVADAGTDAVFQPVATRSGAAWPSRPVWQASAVLQLPQLGARSRNFNPDLLALRRRPPSLRTGSFALPLHAFAETPDGDRRYLAHDHDTVLVHLAPKDVHRTEGGRRLRSPATPPGSMNTEMEASPSENTACRLSAPMPRLLAASWWTPCEIRATACGRSSPCRPTAFRWYARVVRAPFSRSKPGFRAP